MIQLYLPNKYHTIIYKNKIKRTLYIPTNKIDFDQRSNYIKLIQLLTVTKRQQPWKRPHDPTQPSYLFLFYFIYACVYTVAHIERNKQKKRETLTHTGPLITGPDLRSFYSTVGKALFSLFPRFFRFFPPVQFRFVSLLRPRASARKCVSIKY